MKNTKLPETFWMIYQNVQKANPNASKKRIMTLTRYAYNKRYNVNISNS